MSILLKGLFEMNLTNTDIENIVRSKTEKCISRILEVLADADTFVSDIVYTYEFVIDEQKKTTIRISLFNDNVHI